ncbi:MAG: hypothetical protein K2X77_30810 [Candidatus Obscuribacterales bacterium]|nr:hypothetical protein [Candidatus Obscuribacterales bacterium]
MEVIVPFLLLGFFVLWGVSMCKMHDGPSFHATGNICFDGPNALAFVMEHVLKVERISKIDLEKTLTHRHVTLKGRTYLQYMVSYFDTFSRGSEGLIYLADLKR